MNVERLQEFVRLLRNLPEKLPELDSFNLGSWYRNSRTDPYYEGCNLANLDRTVPLKEGFCGTSACALGTAALYGPFKEMGLGITHNNDVIFEDLAAGVSVVNYRAGIRFFGITHDQADWLFYPGSYETTKITPEMVARRVKMILAGTDDVSDFHAGLED